jgi:hypothetical protein
VERVESSGGGEEEQADAATNTTSVTGSIHSTPTCLYWTEDNVCIFCI